MPDTTPSTPTPAPADPALHQRVTEAARIILDGAGPHTVDEWATLVAAAVLADLAPELDELADYRNRITWETTCGGCARTLDSAYAETVRAEQAEAALARVRELHTRTDERRPLDLSLHPIPTCTGCGQPWPCPTTGALTGQPATTGTAVQCSACGGLNGQHWHRCPDRGTPAPAGLRDAIAHELHAAGSPFANTDAETLADAVLTVIQPVLDDLAHARAELADWYARDSADAAAGSYAGRAEQAEAMVAELRETLRRADRELEQAATKWDADLDKRTAGLLRRADQAETERDGAYRERAQLLALLATLYPAVIAPAPDIDEDGWQILYLTIGGRQCTWHISPRDAELLGHVEHVDDLDPRSIWDGHTTAEKYDRIADHIAHRWFVPPAHYERSDGAQTCVHQIPIGPDSCWDCRDLADLPAGPVGPEGSTR